LKVTGCRLKVSTLPPGDLGQGGRVAGRQL
jgi:hypothetical protein